ncbi:hypothetical protein FQA39_LY00648 [Lamprigera yunnana]|nr:hypothetical protein FQA39_LY00648 [Lamprigera yunnana]
MIIFVMDYLKDMNKITILQMIGYGNNTRTQIEVARLLHEKFPDFPSISQRTVSKIEKQFRELGHNDKMVQESNAVVLNNEEMERDFEAEILQNKESEKEVVREDKGMDLKAGRKETEQEFGGK